MTGVSVFVFALFLRACFLRRLPFVPVLLSYVASGWVDGGVTGAGIGGSVGVGVDISCSITSSTINLGWWIVGTLRGGEVMTATGVSVIGAVGTLRGGWVGTVDSSLILNNKPWRSWSAL